MRALRCDAEASVPLRSYAWFVSRDRLCLRCAVGIFVRDSLTGPAVTARGCDGRRDRLPCDNGIQDQQDRQVLENAVKVIYDKETDTLSIILRAGKVAESDEAQP